MKTYQPPYTITSKILSQVSDIVELLSELKHTTGLLSTPKLRKKNRVKSITGTLQIEGNSFSEEKVTDVINGSTVLGTLREITEVQGAIEAYDFLEKYNYANENDLLLSHKKMMDKLLDNAGTYRHTNVGVGGKEGVTHVAPPPNMVQSLMGELFGWLQRTDEHLLIVSCIFHYEFEFIHPFVDGNGRVGRLWQSVILTHYKDIFAQIPIESVVRDNQDKYYRALEASGSVGESTPFIEFMLEVILKTLKNVPNNVPNNVPKDRLLLIVKKMQENRSVTIKEMALALEVNEKTIKRDIEQLKQENRVERIGSARKGYWKVT
jgi:Fic family protein